jgi:long-chain acyl-CoA synthetase
MSVSAEDLLAPRFLRAAAADPDRVAVVSVHGDTTYGELRGAAEAVARAVAPHERIALLARSDAESLAVTLGAMLAGTSIVVLDRHLTEHQIERATTLARPGLDVAPGGRRRTVHERTDVARQRTPEQLIAAGRAAPEPERRARPEDELLIGLTSGTSADPKLFVRGQASWATTLDRSDAAFDVRPGDHVAVPGPLDHSHYFYGALHALTRGATVDLRPVEASFADGSVATHVYVVPTLAVTLAETLGERTQATVRHVISSAAAWPEAARDRLARTLPAATVNHFYGASELSFVTLDSSADAEPEAGSAGRLFPGVELEIRDSADGRPRPEGEQGIVHVRSDMLFDGYLTDDGLRGGPDADGWATVGDLGARRGDRLWVAGRASDTFTSGGINVEPADVERALAELPGVREVACVGLPDDRWGAIPVVALVVDTGSEGPSRAAVRAHARATLPQPSRPWRVFTVDALPRNRRGKLLRRELVARIVAGEAAEVL